MQNKHTKMHRILSIVIYGVLCIFVFLKGAIYFPDSHGFLSMDFHRSIGYKSILKILTSVFGNSFYIPLLLLQLGLLIYASHYLVTTVSKHFKLHYIWSLILRLLIIAPAFYLHNVVNTILSEGITYPMFLVFVALIFKGFVQSSYRHYCYAFLLLLALLLTRGQFIAMVPMLLVLFVLEGFQTTFNKQRWLLIAAVILLPFVSGLIGKTYNKMVYGHFETPPFNNVSLISSAFFVADKDDENLFSSPTEKEFFSQVYNSLDTLSLTKEAIKKSEEPMYSVFHNNYSKVCNLSVHETGKTYFKEQGLDANRQLIAVNDLAGTMVMPLIKNNFKDWLKLYIDNLKNAFGSAKNLLLFLILLITSLVYILKKHQSDVAKFIFATVLMVFANTTIVPLAAHSIKRYLFYTDWILFAILILLLNIIFTKQSISK